MYRQDNRAAAAALIVGSVAYVLILLVHPTRAGGGGVGHVSFSALVHVIGLLTGPMLVFGFVVLSRRLGLDRPAVLLALVFYAMGSMVGTLAPIMSGLVFEQLVDAMRSAAGPERAELARLGRLVFWQNQGFAQVHTAFMSIAVVLWSLAWPARAMAGRALQGLGLLVGLGILAWQASGTMSLDIHGMGAVVLAHGAWTISAAVALWSWGDPAPTATPSARPD